MREGTTPVPGWQLTFVESVLHATIDGPPLVL
jgi:hypothetical protein